MCNQIRIFTPYNGQIIVSATAIGKMPKIAHPSAGASPPLRHGYYFICLFRRFLSSVTDIVFHLNRLFHMAERGIFFWKKKSRKNKTIIFQQKNSKERKKKFFTKESQVERDRERQKWRKGWRKNEMMELSVLSRNIMIIHFVCDHFPNHALHSYKTNRFQIITSIDGTDEIRWWKKNKNNKRKLNKNTDLNSFLSSIEYIFFVYNFHLILWFLRRCVTCWRHVFYYSD